MAITMEESTKNLTLNLKGLSDEGRVEAKVAIGEIIVAEINEHLDRGESPVQGGKYKSEKKDGTTADLFSDGDLRAHITFEESSNGIVVGIFDDAPTVERAKAYAHNTGYKDHPWLEDPKLKREFIPSANKKFNESIMKKVEAELKAIKNEESDERMRRLEEKISNTAIASSIFSFLSDGDDKIDDLIKGILLGN